MIRESRVVLENYVVAQLVHISSNGGLKGSELRRFVSDSEFYSVSKWEMTTVWKRLQRVGKKASKFQFTAFYQSLSVECVRGGKW